MEKFQVMNSTTGRRPAMLAPTAIPVKPGPGGRAAQGSAGCRGRRGGGGRRTSLGNGRVDDALRPILLDEAPGNLVCSAKHTAHALSQWTEGWVACKAPGGPGSGRDPW